MHYLFFFMLILLPVSAFANMVWPALYLETRILSWWAISAGLIIEYLFVRKMFGLSIQRTISAVALANLVSTVAGVFLIPIVGFIWVLIPGEIIEWPWKWASFSFVTWGGTFVLGCLCNALLEGLIYRIWYVKAFKFKSKSFIFLFIANAISVGAAFFSLWVIPVRL